MSLRALRKLKERQGKAEPVVPTAAAAAAEESGSEEEDTGAGGFAQFG